MNTWLTKAVSNKLIRKRYALFKTLLICLLVLNLTACGGKAVSQDVSIDVAEKPIAQKNAQLSKQISEVAPPEVIQELRETLEEYQPQVKILNPQPDKVLQEDKLEVSLQVQDLPIFKNSQYGLGSHLQVILDNQPALEVYDLNQPLELSDLSAGTHTLRVFASRPWHESYKNEGAYAQTTFHVFTKSTDTNPDINAPILTYSQPEGSYGAEPILLDFYLTSAPLHILAKDNPDNPISDWRIRCTVNGESFIMDRWQSLYLTGFNSGKNWVKLEFLDNQGNPVKNVFNSTLRTITYEPNGKDTLAKIVRGELSSVDVRGIVDQNDAFEIPNEETPEVIENPQPESKLEETIPEVIETPEAETTLEETIHEVIETPEAETKLEETIPEVIETQTVESTPEVEIQPIPQPESKLDGFLNRFKRGKQEKVSTPQPTVETTPEIIETPQQETKLEETIPEVIETPQPETKLEEIIPEVIETPTAESTPEVEIQSTPQPESKLDGFLNRFKRGKEDKTEIIETSTPESQINKINTDVEPKIEPTPEFPTTTLPEIVKPLESEIPVTQPEAQIETIPETKPTTQRLKEYFNLPRRATPAPTSEISPEVEVPQNVPVIEQPDVELIEN